MTDRTPTFDRAAWDELRAILCTQRDVRLMDLIDARFALRDQHFDARLTELSDRVREVEKPKPLPLPYNKQLTSWEEQAYQRGKAEGARRERERIVKQLREEARQRDNRNNATLTATQALLSAANSVAVTTDEASGKS